MQHPPKVKEAKGRTAGQGHRRGLILLGIALGLALAFVLLLPQLKQLFPPPKSGDMSHGRNFEVLDKVDPEGLASIAVTHLDGEAYTLRYQEGKLLLERPGQDPVAIQEALAERIIAAATSIAVEDTVTKDEEEVRAHLGDMGLDPPQIQVEAVHRDGRRDSFSLGWKVPETGYYYFRWSGDPGVYMCDEGVYQSFEYTAQMLLPVPRVELEKSLIDRISLSLRGQEPLEAVFATDSQGYQAATLQKPFVYPVDQDSAQALLTAAAQLRLGTRRDEITWENRGEYGFDDPIAQIEIHQQEGVFQQAEAGGALAPGSAPEQTLRLTLGQKVGGFFYTCQYEGQYYYVSSLLVDAFLEVTAEGIATKRPADLGDCEIASISIQAGGRVLELRKTKTEQVLPNNQLATDASGNLVYDVQVTLNGEVIPTDTFDSLVERLKAIQVSGEAGEEGQEGQDFMAGAGTPRWQMSLTTQGGTTRTLAAYPMDAFFDAVAVDGVARHVLHGEALEIALADLVE